MEPSTGGSSGGGSSGPGTTTGTPTTSGEPDTTSGPGTSTGGATATTSDASGSSDATSSTDATDSIGATDATGVMESTGSDGSTGGTPVMGECEVNADCASEACLEFRDLDPDAVCVEGPGGGRTRFPGTVINFVTGAPLPATDVKIVGALDALLDPVNAVGVVAGSSDAAGIVDLTSEGQVQEGIGVVAVVEGGALFLSLTGVATPMNGVYGPMSANHDLWGVPAATLSAWSALLMKEPALAPHLPLGEMGGSVGLVRDSSGAPVAGAVVESVNADSQAKLRYLAQDGMSFNSVATASSGVFVLLGPGLAEKFQVEGVPEASESSGSAGDAIFVMTLELP